MNMVVCVSLYFLLLANFPLTVINDPHHVSTPTFLHQVRVPQATWSAESVLLCDLLGECVFSVLFLSFLLFWSPQVKQQMERGERSAFAKWSNASPLWAFKTKGLVNRRKEWRRRDGREA